MSETDVDIGPLELVSGERLERVVQRVTRYGEAAPDGSNVVLVAHALTGSSRVTDWWGGLAGSGKLFDPAEWCILGINALGGCYGSTGPASSMPDGAHYGARFPIVSVTDIVRAQRRALDALGIHRVAVAIGGSLGGMQALTWAVDYGAMVDHAIVVGAYDAFSAMGIGLNAVARQAIVNDPDFHDGNYALDAQPVRGVRLARMIAMLTYKSDALLEARFANRLDRAGGDPARVRTDRFDVEGYLAYQGDIFAKRMDANSYLALTRAMDLFDVRDRSTRDRSTRLTFVGIMHDWLFPIPYVQGAAARYATLGYDSTYHVMRTEHGHDAFLAETDTLAEILAPELRRTARTKTTGPA
ncbi:MAG: homoserine O-acetyltransferase [Candidatus Velthaea sp.]